MDCRLVSVSFRLRIFALLKTKQNYQGCVLCQIVESKDNVDIRNELFNFFDKLNVILHLEILLSTNQR